MTEVVSQRKFFNAMVKRTILQYQYGKISLGDLVDRMEDIGYKRHDLDEMSINGYFDLPLHEQYEIFVDEQQLETANDP